MSPKSNQKFGRGLSLGLVFENTECRQLLKSMLLAWLIITLLMIATCTVAMSTLTDQMMSREYIVAGKLVKSGNISSSAVTTAFTSPAAESNFAAGEHLLQKTGYGGSTADILLPFLRPFSGSMLTLIILFAFLLLVLLLVPVILLLRMIYGRVDLIASRALSVTGGNYRLQFEEYGEGSFSRLAHAFHDMTGAVEAGFERLEKERNFLKNLISDISHQLKTPLAALKMYNEILENEIATPETAQTVTHFVELSGGQLDRMEWLVLSLLKLAKIEAGALQLERRRTNISEMLASCTAGFREMALDAGVELSLIAPGPVYFSCDDAWLSEAVDNVIKNCIENTPSGGKVLVSTEESPVAVRITVQDNGPGIHPDDLPHIFKRFYQGKGGRNSKGTGVGLSLAKQITEQSGGILTVESRLGEGALFSFTFLKNVI